MAGGLGYDRLPPVGRRADSGRFVNVETDPIPLPLFYGPRMKSDPQSNRERVGPFFAFHVLMDDLGAVRR